MRASMFVIDDTGNYVVLIKRVKAGREYFVVPGGTVEENESLHLAAIREIQEELDMDVSVSSIFEELDEEDNTFFFAKTDYQKGELFIHGEEKGRSSSDNIYKPMWVKINQLLKMEVFPEFDSAVISQIFRKNLR